MNKYTITLNEEDVTTCEELAHARYDSNRSNGITNKRVGPLEDEFIELQGIGGEFAFCRLFGLDPDETINPRSTERDPGDVHLPDGTIVDIKTTHYKSGNLLAVPWKAKGKAQYYGLMIGTFPTFEFKGLAHKDKVFQPHKVADLGWGPTYRLFQHELDKNLLDLEPVI